MNESHNKKAVVDKPTILAGLKKTGIASGDVVLVHSAMRTIGWIENGAKTVVEALLEAVGPKGTIVAPTYTFKHQRESDPIIDPAADPSEMGAISEEIRRHPQARRSIAYRHSVAAIGRQAQVITEVDPLLCPFDPRASFGVMLSLNAQVLVLGVTYSSVTACHLSEWFWEVPYRRAFPKPARIRHPGGRLQPVTFTDYRPKPDEEGGDYEKRPPDYNRVGSALEGKGKVGIAAVGNAVARRFALRDLVDFALREMETDFNVLRTGENETGKITPLKEGKIVLVDLTDAGGTTETYQWAVVDPSRLSLPPGVGGSILNEGPLRAG